MESGHTTDIHLGRAIAGDERPAPPPPGPPPAPCGQDGGLPALCSSALEAAILHLEDPLRLRNLLARALVAASLEEFAPELLA